MDRAFAGAVSHLRHGAEDQVTHGSSGWCPQGASRTVRGQTMANARNKQDLRRANMRLALILGAVALGLFIFTLVRAFK